MNGGCSDFNAVRDGQRQILQLPDEPEAADGPKRTWLQPRVWLVSDASLNGFSSSPIAGRFREEPCRFPICTDKFQTGYSRNCLPGRIQRRADRGAADGSSRPCPRDLRCSYGRGTRAGAKASGLDETVHTVAVTAALMGSGGFGAHLHNYTNEYPGRGYDGNFAG